jgi:hypothetical protein
VHGIFHGLPIIEGTIPLVNISVVGDVIAHVRLRGFVDGGEPNNIDTEIV